MGRRYQPEQAAALLSGDMREQDRFNRFCHAIARRGTLRFGVRAWHDDIAQDLALFLFNGPITDFATKQITSDQFVIAALNASRTIAQRYQRAEIRERTKTSSHESTDCEAWVTTPMLLRDDADPESVMIERETVMGKNKAIAAVRAKIAATPTQLPSAMRSAPKAARRAKQINAYVDPPSLHELLSRIGWSYHDASAVLGADWHKDVEIRFAPCTNINYRRILRAYNSSVPREHIADVLRRWAQILAFEPDDYRGLAERLNVDYTTFYRWKTERTQSNPVLRAKLSRAVYTAQECRHE